MGCAHSVHILMQINIKILGRTIHHHPWLVAKADSDGAASLEIPHDVASSSVLEDDVFYACDDQTWWKRQLKRRDDRTEAGFSVDEWCSKVRSLRMEEVRTFVVLLLFAGERRPGDIHECIEKQALFHGLSVFVTSAELATDSRWDLADPTTFSQLLEMAEAHIDATGGGPPCSTVSRARFNRRVAGPRPVRFRKCFWGRSGFSNWERSRVTEANQLYINKMALDEKVSSRGSSHWTEHPLDPGCEPYPSLWNTPEMKELESRTKAVRLDFHQCVFGAPVPKATTISTTCPRPSEFFDAWCPGVSDSHSF